MEPSSRGRRSQENLQCSEPLAPCVPLGPGENQDINRFVRQTENGVGVDVCPFDEYFADAGLPQCRRYRRPQA